MKSEDGTVRHGGTLALLACFVDVVTEVDDIVVLVLSGSIAVSVEIAVGCKQRSIQ